MKKDKKLFRIFFALALAVTGFSMPGKSFAFADSSNITYKSRTPASGTDPVTEVEIGQTFTLPDNPYTFGDSTEVFKGWAIDGKLYQPGAEVTATSNMLIEAVTVKDTTKTVDTVEITFSDGVLAPSVKHNGVSVTASEFITYSTKNLKKQDSGAEIDENHDYFEYKITDPKYFYVLKGTATDAKLIISNTTTSTQRFNIELSNLYFESMPLNYLSYIAQNNGGEIYDYAQYKKAGDMSAFLIDSREGAPINVYFYADGNSSVIGRYPGAIDVDPYPGHPDDSWERNNSYDRFKVYFTSRKVNETSSLTFSTDLTDTKIRTKDTNDCYGTLWVNGNGRQASGSNNYPTFAYAPLACAPGLKKVFNWDSSSLATSSASIKRTSSAKTQTTTDFAAAYTMDINKKQNVASSVSWYKNEATFTMKPKTYSVSYDLGDYAFDELPMATETYSASQEYVFPECKSASKASDGKFVGWQFEGKIYQPGDVYVVPSTVTSFTVKALWSHNHDWTLKVDGNKIVANCSKSDCPVEGKSTYIQVNMPETFEYDGNPVGPTFENDDYFDLYTEEDIVVKYYDSSKVEISAPSDVGSYKIKVYSEIDPTKVYEKEFEIVASPVVVEGLDPKNPTYNGGPQALLETPTVTGGTIQYSLDGEAWSDDIPTGIDVGTYTVYYKTTSTNPNYKGAIDSVDCEIKKIKFVDYIGLSEYNLQYNFFIYPDPSTVHPVYGEDFALIPNIPDGIPGYETYVERWKALTEGVDYEYCSASGTTPLSYYNTLYYSTGIRFLGNYTYNDTTDTYVYPARYDLTKTYITIVGNEVTKEYGDPDPKMNDLFTAYIYSYDSGSQTYTLKGELPEEMYDSMFGFTFGTTTTGKIGDVLTTTITDYENYSGYYLLFKYSFMVSTAGQYYFGFRTTLEKDSGILNWYSNNKTSMGDIVDALKDQGVIAEGKLTIAAKTLTEDDVSPIKACITGMDISPYQPTVTVLDPNTGKNLVLGTDYTVTYQDNTEVGVAKAIITGIGNYRGEVTKEYKIVDGSTHLNTGSIINNAIKELCVVDPDALVKEYNLEKVKNVVFELETICPSGVTAINVALPSDLAEIFMYLDAEGTLHFVTETTNIMTNADCSNMFSGLTKLKSIDLTKLDPQNTTDISGMFKGDESLEVLDFGNFRSVNTHDDVIDGVDSLNTLSISNNLSNVLNDLPDGFWVDGSNWLVDDSYFMTYQSDTFHRHIHTMEIVSLEDGILEIGCSNSDGRCYYFPNVTGTVTGAEFDKASHLPVVELTGLTLGTDFEIVIPDGTDTINASDDIPFIINFIGNYKGEIYCYYAISKKELTVTMTSTYTKTYDFTTSVDPDAIGDTITLSLVGLVTSDSSAVTVEASSYVLADGVGSVELTASEFSLVGELDIISNYTIKSENAKANVTVTAFDLSNATITITDPTYTGTNVTPDVVVTVTDVLGNTQTVPSELYNVSYANNLNAATKEDASAPSATVTANSDKLSNSKTEKFTILPLDIKDATIELDGSLTYNGVEQTQYVKPFKVNGLDVTFDYENNKATNVKTDGTYTLLVKGNGNFTGSVEVEFSVSPYSIDSTKVTVEFTEVFTYAEDLSESDKIKVQIPTTATIKIVGQSDYLGTDPIDTSMFYFTLSEGFEGKYGKNTVTITFGTNFAESCEAEYTILPKEITITGGGEKEYLEKDPIMYTADGIITADKDATILSGNLVRAAGENVGQYSFTGCNVVVASEYQDRYKINFVNNGEKFTINKKVISVDDIIVPENLEYDGTSKTITIAFDSIEGTYTLQLGVDYTVVYSHENGTNDSTSAGSINATITYISSNFDGLTNKPYTITKKKVTITGVSAENKVYDGTTEATWTGTPVINGLVSSDVGGVKLKEESDKIVGTATFANKNVGNFVSVLFTDFELVGDNAVNYEVVQPEMGSANITPYHLTLIGYIVEDKVYDGTTIANIDTSSLSIAMYPTVDQGKIGIDVSTFIGNFADKNVGSNKSITITLPDLTGSEKANYVIDPILDLEASITKKDVTIKGLEVESRQYDGSTVGTIIKTGAYIDGLVGNDSYLVNIVYGNATFNSKNVGEDQDVVFTGFSIEGLESGNYNLASQPETVKATITKRDVTIKDMSVLDKVYDGNIIATIVDTNAYIDGIVEADLNKVSIVNGNAIFATKNVGSSIIVSFGGFSLAGEESSNYNLTGQPEAITKAITTRYVTVTVSANTREFDGTNKISVTGVVNNVVNGEEVIAVIPNNLGYLEDSNIGENKLVTVSGISLSGANASNYGLLVNETTDDRIATCVVTIAPKTVSSLDISLDIEEFDFTGGQIKPEPKVTEDVLLVKDQDYTVTYSNNTNKGTATITITLIGNYSGEFTKDFTINPKFVDIIWGDNDFKYTGEAQEVIATYIDVNGESKPLDVEITQDGASKEFKETGVYIATVSVSDPNYVISEENQKEYVIKWVNATKSTGAENAQEVSVLSENGIDPRISIVLVDVKAEQTEEEYQQTCTTISSSDNFGRRDVIVNVIDVSLVNEAGEFVQPDGEISIVFNIPAELIGKSFNIYHIHNGELKVLDYEIDGDKAIVKTSELSLFAFINTSIVCYNHIYMIALFVLVLAFLIVWWGVLGHRYFYYDKNDCKEDDKFFVRLNKKHDLIAIAVSFVHLVLSIVFIFIRSCTACDVFVILNFVLWLIYFLMFILEWVGYGIIWVGKKLLELLGIKYEYQRETTPIIVSEPETKELTLKESLAVAALVGGSGVTKKSILNHLKSEFGDKLELNHRANSTAPGRGKTEGLPLADTHYVLGDKRVCFAYIYEDANGSVLMLLRTSEAIFKDVKKDHKSAAFSSFPKVSSDNKWYSLPVDNSYSEAEVYLILDRVVKEYLGETDKELTLKESLAVAAAVGGSAITKKSICAHLEAKYGLKVELNNRANITAPGRGKTEGLPLADTHYVLGDKRVCFAYIYEDANGSVLMLLRTNESIYKDVKKDHKSAAFSAFPKVSNGNKWYSLPVDNSYLEAEVYSILDRVVDDYLGENNDDSNKGLSLKESLNTIKDIGAKGIVTKKFIAEYLSKNYGDKVELNCRANSTAPGRGKTEGLPLADTHYNFVSGDKKCFIYVYEINDSTLLLVKTDSEYGNELKKSHKLVSLSAFPKSPFKWYSIPVDDSWTEKQVCELLDKLMGNSEVKKETKPAIEPVKPTKIVEKVEANKVNELMSNSKAIELSTVSKRVADKSRKTMINIDMISEYFKDGETVTLKEIKNRVPGFDKKATYYKVCAKGTLDKALIVDADDFSVEAKKMILLTGGKVIISSK